jgi:putative tricarboxylic transport membrane protein
LLLPTTFFISPVSAVIMLAGIYYGSMYGGTITSVLVNIPGEPATIVTCLSNGTKGKGGASFRNSCIRLFYCGHP